MVSAPTAPPAPGAPTRTTSHPAPAAPPPPAKVAEAPSTTPKVGKLEISSGQLSGAERIGLYGAGGIGKSSLASWLPAPLFLDLERGTRRINVSRDTVAVDWSGLRGKVLAFEKSPPPGVQSLVIDSGTVAQNWAEAFVVATRTTTESGKPVRSIEDYGWGKGWHFVYDEFNALLADLDRIVDVRGIHVCLILHSVSSEFPNPSGENYIRWEPHLYSGDKKGRGSIRDRVFQWSDHFLFVGYDVAVRDGKGIGSGTRTIYSAEMPTHVAKSRSNQTAIPYTLSDPARMWRELGILSA